MLLSLRHRFLFVHIAKTGGTSVRAALSPLRWQDPSYIAQFICSRLSHLSGHKVVGKFPRHAKIIAAKELLPREIFEPLFKFCFVRNPWDLQVSSFHHIQRERPEFMQGITDFNEFMRWKLDPGRPYQYHLDTSIELQSDYVCDLHGNIIVDFIGRYENLTEDFDRICNKIGITPKDLPHKRRAAERKDFREYYNDETVQLVEQHFRRDIENFGYRFDGD